MFLREASSRIVTVIEVVITLAGSRAMVKLGQGQCQNVHVCPLPQLEMEC